MIIFRLLPARLYNILHKRQQKVGKHTSLCSDEQCSASKKFFSLNY
jgi:hypothetical protein